MYAAIPTTYRGVNFRSRLEARWAAYFDLKGDSEWQYEPIDLNGYIPDFFISGKGFPLPVLAEVKPVSSIDQFLNSSDSRKMAHAVFSDIKKLFNTPYNGLVMGIVVLGLDPKHQWWFNKNATKVIAGIEPLFIQMPFPKNVDVIWREAGNRVQWRAPR